METAEDRDVLQVRLILICVCTHGPNSIIERHSLPDLDRTEGFQADPGVEGLKRQQWGRQGPWSYREAFAEPRRVGRSRNWRPHHPPFAKSELVHCVGVT